MCEINPKHRAFFHLEASTSLDMTEEEFVYSVAQKLLDVEMQLNKDGRFRFYIYGAEET